ncbi:two-component system response regulator [Halomonas urumqiensis]|uniref:Two-component system response regulator n=2 Tax=Halomonas urumqiensis TaxID=1684789 RepID=A0A2N7UGY3_9GAMM|nr:two-component system response regulator [Halomonas urumqiensis]PTB04262.1 DNA-binding response regulator [Halomonas urumqiensis]
MSIIKPPTDARPLVLCAEDHGELRLDICDELREAGYAVIEAADGDEALEQIDNLAAPPDLILCDINMPGRNGYQVLETLRDDYPSLADMPFVFLTALSDSRDVIDGKRLGADDYLSKPIDYDLMLATVEARLRQVRRIREQTNREFDTLRQAMNELRRKASRQGFESTLRALDLVSPGLVLIDENGHALFANRQARQLICQANGLRLERTLTAFGGDRARELRGTLRTALKASQAGEETVSCLRLARPGERRDLLVLACSLPKAQGSDPSEPAAVILLADPEQRARLPQQVLANLFGLTPTEARIALALAEGKRSEDIAAQLSIAATTVAFHLRNLFQKTDTHRQADLIALVLSGAMSVSLEED